MPPAEEPYSPTDALLRYRDRHRCTRRYDHLWHRIGQHVPWVATHGVSTHLAAAHSWVERHFGYGTARAYAGPTGPATTTCVKANL
jgi:hypothetical protein